MNISAWHIYLLTRLDGVNAAAGLTALVSIMFLALALFVRYVQNTQNAEFVARLNKSINWLAVTFTCAMAINLLLPTSKEMAAIWVLPRIANSQTVGELGDATVTLAKQWLEELKPKQGGKEGAK